MVTFEQKPGDPPWSNGMKVSTYLMYGWWIFCTLGVAVWYIALAVTG